MRIIFSFIFSAKCLKHYFLFIWICWRLHTKRVVKDHNKKSLSKLHGIDVKYITSDICDDFMSYVKSVCGCKLCIIIMMVLSMSLLLTLFHNSTHFLSTHRFFSSSLSNQRSLHYWHLTIIIANSLRLSSSLSRFYGVAWLWSGTNISRLCIIFMPF